MKRSARELDEPVDVDGVLVLPKNVTVRKVTFSLSNLSSTDLNDMELITTIVSHCALNMAKKHHRVEVFLHSHRESFKGYSLTEYTIQMLMPAGVALPDSHQLNAVHNLRPTLLQNPITQTLCPETPGAYVLEIPFYSYRNEFIVTRKLITQIEIRELVPLASLMTATTINNNSGSSSETPRVIHPPIEESGDSRRARSPISKKAALAKGQRPTTATNAVVPLVQQ